MNNMQGIYTVFVNGKRVAEQPNMLSQIGRRAAIRSMVGATNNFADRIVLGIGDNANTVASGYLTDQFLNFEVLQSPLAGVGMGLADDEAVIFSGKFSSKVDTEVREIGLLPTNIYGAANQDKMISLFNDDARVTASGAAAVTEYSEMRTDGRGLYIPNGESATLEFPNEELIFLGSLNTSAEFKIAGYKTSATAGSITVRFLRADDTYKEATVLTPAESGYFIVSFDSFFGEYNPATLPDIDIVRNDDYVAISFDVAEDHYLDAMRVDNGAIPGHVLASRAVLPTPILLRANVPMVVEYRLVMGFNV